MILPIIIHKDEGAETYGVTVPGLKGCFSAGDSLEEATMQVREALELHIEYCFEKKVNVDEDGNVMINTNIEHAFDEAEGGIVVCIMYEHENAVAVTI